MTLRRKLTYQIVALIVSLLLISAASLWGLNGLQQNLGAALRGYETLRGIYEVGAHVSTAKTLLNLDVPYNDRAGGEIRTAVSRLEMIAPSGSTAGLSVVRPADVDAIRHTLVAAGDQVRSGSPNQPMLDRSLGQIANLAADIRSTIKANEDAARDKKRKTMLMLAIVGGSMTIGAILIGLSQYRGVMRPLNRLALAARRIAAGRFADRVEPKGNAEFVTLAEDFNRMAEHLEGVYRDLEQKIAAKSRELVRSERLAGVGYLAAGVAHEINNPLSIITGYAELTLKQLELRMGAEDSNDPRLAEAQATLKIVCEESFRCKKIIEKLLSLARTGDEGRKPIELAHVAQDVVTLLGGLKKFGGRELTFHSSDPAPTRVLASESEMKQVLLNLIMNALEAAPDEGGKVRVSVERRNGWVEMIVSDNGRGMSATTLERVFEPFFTTARSAGGAGASEGTGVGLGLSITHAIVQNHGGSIDAHSAGPGQGSRFVVQLPPAEMSTAI